MQNEATQIPRRIIQTAKSKELPLFGQAAVANIKLLNPDFEYCFFDNSQVISFIEEKFPEYRDVFEGFPHAIQKYDFFRYLAVFALGGFYFDTDVFLARSLSPLLAHQCVFPFEELTLMQHLRSNCKMDWELGNYAFGAVAGNPFLKALIDACVEVQKNPLWAKPMMQGIAGPFRSQFVVTNSTGPGMVSRIFAERRELRSNVTVLFPKDVCDERSHHHFGDYGIHLMQGSWRKSDGFFLSRATRIWENRKRAKFLRESRSLGARRSGDWVSA